MASFQDRLLAKKECGPRLISGVIEIVLYFALFASFGIRYRRHFVSGRPKHRGTSKASPPAIKTPYEVYLMIAFGLVPYAFTAAKPILASHGSFRAFLQSIDLSNIYISLMIPYIVLMHIFEEWSFRKYLLRPYWAKKVTLPAAEVSSETAKEDLETMRIDATIADVQAEDCQYSSAPPSPERTSRWQSFKSFFQPQIPDLTPSNILYRYHIRAFAKVMPAWCLFSVSRTLFCEANSTDPPDTTGAMGAFVLIGIYMTVNAVQVLVTAWRFGRSELVDGGWGSRARL